MAFFELFRKRLLIVSHSLLEFFSGNIFVINLNVKILTSRERIIFLPDLVYCYDNREIINDPLIIKSSYTLKANDEKGKKMSKALNRFKKKMSQAQPNIPPKNY